jgi:hypothetical protein
VTKKIFYEKVGRKYVPVSEYDHELSHALPKGTHLIMVYPGGSSTRYKVDPMYAPMIAAGRVAEDALANALVKAGELRLGYKSRERRLTDEQREAWNHLVEVFGDDAKQLEWPSAREACEEAVKAMTVEADKLLANPSVRKAYERFLFVAELTKEHNVQNDLY